MKLMFIIWSCVLALTAQAAVYDHHELQQQLQNPQLEKLTQAYNRDYFTSGDPQQVVDDLIAADLSPLYKEAILFQLLTAVSQQPPQPFHQYLVDTMKTYPVAALIPAEEGPISVPVFNLNSKAKGTENIWMAYRAEQRFQSLFAGDLVPAMTAIKTALQLPAAQQRPQWLGIKKAFNAMSEQQQSNIAQYLSNQVQVNQGLDPFISQVGLVTANKNLIQTVLLAQDTAVRQFTLRQLSHFFTAQASKDILLDAAQQKIDEAFTTSLLGQYTDDPLVQQMLIQKLATKTVADAAAFALAQSKDPHLIEQLRIQYLKSALPLEKNNILLVLKLNTSNASKLALADLQNQLPEGSAADRWLKSFKGGKQ